MSKETVTGIYEAFGRRDIAALLHAMADDVQWEMPGPAPFSGSRKGLAAVQQFFQELAAAVNIEKFEVDFMVAEGENVVVMGRERSTVRATGRTGEHHWAHAWTVRDGKVVHVRLYEDTHMQATMFAVPALAASGD
jgi:uncharacterized protein